MKDKEYVLQYEKLPKETNRIYHGLLAFKRPRILKRKRNFLALHKLFNVRHYFRKVVKK